jgi:hypothetical protein
MNPSSYLAQLKERVRENLHSLTFAPSVEFSEVPPIELLPELDETELSPDERYGGRGGLDGALAADVVL